MPQKVLYSSAPVLTICLVKNSLMNIECRSSPSQTEHWLSSPASSQRFPPALQLPWQRGKEREREVQTSTPRPDSMDRREKERRKKNNKRGNFFRSDLVWSLYGYLFLSCLPSGKITVAALPWWEAGRLLWHLECRMLNMLPLRHCYLWWRRAQNGEEIWMYMFTSLKDESSQCKRLFMCNSEEKQVIIVSQSL